MIYPKKAKIRKFEGGGMTSFFNNPGTYLGVQFVPTAQELPEIDGLQYIAQMEKARYAKKVESAKANALNSDDIRKSLEGLKGLYGEHNSAINLIENEMAAWQQKYPDVNSMSSTQAANDKARILNNISRISNYLLNSKEQFEKDYENSKDIHGDIVTDGGSIYIVNPEDPSSGPTAVPIDEYFKNRETTYADMAPMKTEDVFNWRRNHRQFGTRDNVSIDQYSEKDTRAYINSHFDKIGIDTRSIDGAGEFASILESAGIDPSKFNRDDLKVKISNGELNLQTLSNSFIKTMDKKVLRSLVSSMVSQGENPYEKVTVDGSSEPISKINLRIHEIITGQKAKINNSIEIATNDSGDGSGGAYDVITNVLGRTGNLDAITVDPVMKDMVSSLVTYNPHTGNKITARGMIVPNMSKEDIERLNGDEMKFGRIANDQTVYVNGEKKVIGSVTDSSDGALFFDTGIPLNVITFDIPTGNGDAVSNVIEKEILVNEAGLMALGIDPKKYKETPGVREVDDSELAALPGISPELVTQLEGWGWGNDGENYLVRIQSPLSSLAGHGGKSPGKASSSENSTFNRGVNQRIQQAEAINQSVSQTASDMRAYIK